MKTVLLTSIAAIAALVVLFVVWGGVHLLAQARMGWRSMGCKGPIVNEDGAPVCCKTGEACERTEVDLKQQDHEAETKPN